MYVFRTQCVTNRPKTWASVPSSCPFRGYPLSDAARRALASFASSSPKLTAVPNYATPKPGFRARTTAMGIVNRMGRALRANLNSLLDSDQPDRVVDEAVSELQEVAKQAKRDLITARGSHKRLNEDVERLTKEVRHWEDRAALALRHGDEGLAREALQQKLAIQRRVEQTQRDANQYGYAAHQLEQTISRVEQEARELAARKGALVADVLAARARKLPGGQGNTALGEEWSRATDRVSALEAEIEASSVLDDPKRATLDARFAALEKQADDGAVEDQLQSLKDQLSATDKHNP